MNPLQEAELTSGKDTNLHAHPFDRSPTHDTLLGINQVEGVRFLDASYAATANDDVLMCDTTAGAFSVFLPPPRGGKRYSIVRIAGANDVTVQAVGGTINGAAFKLISSDYVPLRVKAWQTGYVEC